ncbi:hypothetical protein CYY_009107 [Polysphondylium violaceum]|uniref:Uncharacterized protein n=1 Tax=Polysphondylium violaceum TaxID=133409 RepID=A0A8J4PU69_9MYCE|nr:hypothetical protein CYY_009107 [Polysphondylium violaceum]
MYTHTVEFNRESSPQTFSSSVNYINPEITSYECIRGFKQVSPYGGPQVINKCKFVGHKLHTFFLISGIGDEIETTQVSFSSINVTLTDNLPLGVEITLDTREATNRFYKEPTGAIFQPVPKCGKTFSYERDPNGYVIVNIQGTYLDAVSINDTKITDGDKTLALNCRYYFITSIADGYVETISCFIPQINYEKATITLTPTYYPNDLIVISPIQDSSTPSSGNFILPSFSLMLTLFWSIVIF